ncbi:unnamed protein product [Rotaria socialis]
MQKDALKNMFPLISYARGSDKLFGFHRKSLWLKMFIEEFCYGRKQLKEQCEKPCIEENQHDLFSKYYDYRGQMMSKIELNNIRKSLGNIISVKSFLSTCIDRKLALYYLGQPESPNESSVVSVLIEICLGNNTRSSFNGNIFADITEQSYFGEVEKKVLFMSGSYFQVDDVRYGDEQIRRSGALYDNMRTSFIYSDFTFSSDTGIVLFQSGKFDQAEYYYLQILHYLVELLYQSEDMKDNDQHQQSTYWIDKYSILLLDRSSRQYFEIEMSSICFTAFYMLTRRAHEKGNYTQSILQYENDDFDDITDLAHVCKGHRLIGLGNLSLIERKCRQAISYYRNALALFDKYVPMGHPDQLRAQQKIANINRIYRCKTDAALGTYKNSLESYLHVLPSDHVDIARIYIWI